MKLHIGCGKRDFGKDWIHIDGGDFQHLHSHDIAKLPFASESADLVYASHVIEYFDREEIKPILKEWWRVLKYEGKLRIAVPDFKKIIEVYESGRRTLDNLQGLLYGKMTMGSKVIYHKTVYDERSLDDLLQIVGFPCSFRYDWGTTEHAGFDDHSQAYIPHMHKATGTLMSLNIEATKKRMATK